MASAERCLVLPQALFAYRSSLQIVTRAPGAQELHGSGELWYNHRAEEAPLALTAARARGLQERTICLTATAVSRPQNTEFNRFR
jgi:hypothetical protein